MEVKDCIKKRRSIRKYQDREISWSLISEILEHAVWAPAAGNIQNYKFIIVRNLEKRKELAEISYNQEWMSQAPVHIVVCSSLKNLRRFYGERGEENYAYQNANAAIQNLLLAAHDLGLGTCWVAAFDDKKLIEALSIIEDVKPIAIITLGYAKESPIVPQRAPLSTMVYFEKWGELKRNEVQEIQLNKKLTHSISKIKGLFKNDKRNTNAE